MVSWIEQSSLVEVNPRANADPWNILTVALPAKKTTRRVKNPACCSVDNLLRPEVQTTEATHLNVFPQGGDFFFDKLLHGFIFVLDERLFH